MSSTAITWRLYRALETVTPVSVRDFLNLAAVQIRRELTDLARYYSKRQAVFHAGQFPGEGDSNGSVGAGVRPARRLYPRPEETRYMGRPS